jgi:hypothetical protein
VDTVYEAQGERHPQSRSRGRMQTPAQVCRSVDRRQANFGEELPEGRIAVKAAEILVIAKIQHDLAMRLDADGQVLERLARVAEPGVGPRHKTG